MIPAVRRVFGQLALYLAVAGITVVWGRWLAGLVAEAVR